jgi:hypothetical protein
MAQLRHENVYEYEERPDGSVRIVFGEPRLASVPAAKPKKATAITAARAPLHSLASAALDGFQIHPEVVE